MGVQSLAEAGTRRSSIGVQWEFNGNSMDFNGNSMEIQWKFNEIQWNSMGIQFLAEAVTQRL